jgi:hypothetical protein
VSRFALITWCGFWKPSPTLAHDVRVVRTMADVPDFDRIAQRIFDEHVGNDTIPAASRSLPDAIVQGAAVHVERS